MVSKNHFITDTDIQCDFNNPFWQEVECAWTLTSSLNSKPIERLKANDISAENYWHAEDNFADNYYLAGSYIGEHKFLSEWQDIKDAPLLDPIFGFSYKAINTQFIVSLIKESGEHVLIMDFFVEKIEETDSDGGWNYVSKNLSQVESWHSGDPTKWQV